MPREGIEPPTKRLEGSCSIHLATEAERVKRQYSLATVEHGMGTVPAAWQLHTMRDEHELTKAIHILECLCLLSRVNTGAWDHP